jgi:hypothetical protein
MNFLACSKKLGTKSGNVTEPTMPCHQMRKERLTVTRKTVDGRKAKCFPSLACYVRNEEASWATGPLHRGPAESSGD